MEDKILEQELIRNERVITHSKFGALRLRRATPAMEASIAEQRRRVYHKDLKDDTILTKDEVAKILERRGIWTSVNEEVMQDLTIKSGDLMVKLTALGYDPTQNLYNKIRESLKKLEESCKEAGVQDGELERIFYSPEIPTYDDLKTIKKFVTTPANEAELQVLNTLIMQMDLLKDFAEVKKQLQQQMVTYTKFFGDTIEERANRAERLAHIFYCVTTVDGDSRLWDKFEDIWDEDPDDVSWLHSQLFNFQNGITDEYAEVLKTYGFMERVNDTGASSEDSQDHPQSKSDGESPGNRSQASSLAIAVTT